MSNNPSCKHEVLIKQYLHSILDVSGAVTHNPVRDDCMYNCMIV